MMTIVKYVSLCLFFVPSVYGLTLANGVDINFGILEFSGYSGDNAIGTNGSITYGSSFSGSSLGTAGAIEIQDTTGTVVEIACEKTGTIADISGNDISLNNAEVSIGLGNGQPHGSGTSCNGIKKTVITHTISANSANNTLLIGLNMRTNNQQNSIESGIYRTDYSGGSPITVRILVQ